MKISLKLLLIIVAGFIVLQGCQKEGLNTLTNDIISLEELESRSEDTPVSEMNSELVRKLVTNESFRAFIKEYMLLIAEGVKQLEDTEDNRQANFSQLEREIQNFDTWEEVPSDYRNLLVNSMGLSNESDLEAVVGSLNHHLANISRQIPALTRLDDNSLQLVFQEAQSLVVTEMIDAIDIDNDLALAFGNIYNFRCIYAFSYEDRNGNEFVCDYDTDCRENFTLAAQTIVGQAVHNTNTDCILTPIGVVSGVTALLGGNLAVGVVGTVIGGFYGANCIYNVRQTLRSQCKLLQNEARSCCFD